MATKIWPKLDDPTVASAEDRRKVASYTGTSLQEVSPEALAFVVEKSKHAGNQAFKKKHFEEAVKCYSQAIAGCESDKANFSNRSAAYLALGRVDEAVWDAQKTIAVDSDWPKGYYRLGSAYMAMCEWSAATAAFRKGAELSPDSKEMTGKLEEAERKLKEELTQKSAQVDMAVRDTVLKLRRVRQAEARKSLMNQYKASMVAPDYEMDDYEWRPTFMPQMKLTKINQKHFFQKDPVRSHVCSIVNALADLTGPKNALSILNDTVRLGAYQIGIERALDEQPGAHMLCVGSGSGVLSLMAARSGAGHVSSCERSKTMYGMAKIALNSNRGAVGVDNITLISGALKTCKVVGEIARTTDTEDSAHIKPSFLQTRADILVTDLIDFSVLGMDLMDTLDYAGKNLLAPGARVVPSRITIHVALAEVGRVSDVRGFDLSALNVYRWYPHHEEVYLQSTPHRFLSKPIQAHVLDLQKRVDSAVAWTAGDAQDFSAGRPTSADGAGLPQWELDETKEITVEKEGVVNAIIWWFSVDACPANGGHQATFSNNGASASQPTADGAGPLPEQATSWGVACQYMDELHLQEGSKVNLRIRQDRSQMHFSLVENPHSRIRHDLVPRWHFDMVLDNQRNEMYENAIQRAIRHQHAIGNKEVHVLDAGAGTGILSLMAARAGAKSVISVEQNNHMADVGEECLVRNGKIGQCIMLSSDVRRLTMGKNKPDGGPPDLEHAINMMVFEVFDAGLIGEGALHILAHVQQRLVGPDYTLVPQSATLYCQGIQMRIDDVMGFDMAQMNRYRWRPTYEGMELGQCTHRWKALTAVQEVFSFDFRQWQQNMRPTEVPVDLDIVEDGICNAIAFWFELHLDDKHTLSSSPYSDKGATWPQAVQWLQEVRVQKGKSLPIAAKHDTYEVSFQVDDSIVDLEEVGTSVPLYDPSWHNQFRKMEEINKQLAKSCAQNPLEFRRIAEAAVHIGSRPYDFGVDCQKAAELCAKLMS